MNSLVLRASHNFPLSYESRDLKISILFKKSSNFSHLLIALVFTIWLKVSQSKQKRTDFWIALIEAALGVLYNRDNSPKSPPLLY